MLESKLRSVGDSTEDEGELVYHYTSVNTFTEILKSNKLRATDLRFLNDKTEKQVWNEVFVEAVNEVREQYTDKINSKTIDAKIDDIKEFLYEIGNVMNTHLDKECYIISLSYLADDKNQFIMYGDSSKGLSIGFNKNRLKEAIDDSNSSPTNMSGFFFGRISYDLQTVKKDVVEILEGMVEDLVKEKKTPDDFIKEFEYSFKGRVNEIFLRCQDAKNPYFKSEEEYRLYWMQESSNRSKDVGIFARNSRIIPFVNFDFKEGKLPISEIIIGPDNKPEVKTNIEAVLKLLGYSNVKVRLSDIPYTS